MKTQEYIKIEDDGKLTTSELMKQHKEKFSTYSYWNDEELDKYFLPPPTKTTRYFLKQQEPDRLNVSYNNLKKEKVEFMTFREYLLFFRAYFDETGKYPDEVGWTTFSDEGLPDGRVADGCWVPDDSQSGFDWLNPDVCNPDVGARLAISNPFTFPPSSLAPDKINVGIRFKELKKELKVNNETAALLTLAEVISGLRE